MGINDDGVMMSGKSDIFSSWLNWSSEKALFLSFAEKICSHISWCSQSCHDYSSFSLWRNGLSRVTFDPFVRQEMRLVSFSVIISCLSLFFFTIIITLVLNRQLVSPDWYFNISLPLGNNKNLSWGIRCRRRRTVNYTDVARVISGIAVVASIEASRSSVGVKPE